MPLISKKNVQKCTHYILSPQYERITLLVYVTLYTAIVTLSASKIAGSEIEQYVMRQSMIDYYNLEPNISEFSNYSQFYNYVENILTKKLWVVNKSSPLQPMGLARIIQFRVDSSNCKYYKLKCDLNISEHLSHECEDEKYSEECNKLFYDYHEKFYNMAQTYEIPFSNHSQCALEDCHEYHQRETNLTQYMGYAGDYKGNTFLVDLDFNATKTKEILRKLQSNRWIDEFTRCVLFQWNVYSTWFDSFFIFIVSVEEFGDGILQTQFKLSSVNASIKAEDTITLVYIFLLITLLLMIIRMVYEMHYELSNKFTNLFEILQFIINFGALFSHITNSSFLKQQLLTFSFQDYNQFYNFNNYIILWNVQLAMIGFGVFFVPFRFFQIICQFEQFSQFNRLLNSMFRLLPYVLQMLFTVQLILFLWSFGFFIVANADVLDFRNIIESFYSLNFREYYNDQDFIEFMSDPFFKTLYGVILFTLATRITAFSLIIATVMYLYRKALSLEKNDIVTPQQTMIMNDIIAMNNEVEQLELQRKQQWDTTSVEKSFANKAVVGWVLCCDNEKNELKSLCEQMFQEINEELIESQPQYSIGPNQPMQYSPTMAKKNLFSSESPTENKQDRHQSIQHINPIIFDQSSQMIPFLQSYFLVKPQLITSQSYRRFRIVVQNLVLPMSQDNKSKDDYRKSKKKGVFSQYGNGYLSLSHQQHNLTELLEYLKETGSKVPVLLYFNNEIDLCFNKFLSKRKRQYPKLLWSNDPYQVRNFCKMEDLSSFLSTAYPSQQVQIVQQNQRRGKIIEIANYKS